MRSHSSFAEISRQLTDGSLTCVQVVEHYLQNIRAKNSELNALLSVYDEEALERAALVDGKLQAGSAGKLAGMVVSIKDVLCYQDHPLQCGSEILNGFESQFNATAVQRLLDEDAIIIGRNNCDEFAMGSSNENSAFGPVRNADNPNRVPGGSSGGSAVAVQADMCAVSLGTDTGGSVRQPASFCGILGLKPTYSRISRHGLAAYASTFDTIGVFAHHVADMALVMEVIAGEDANDSTVSRQVVPAYSQQLEVSSKKKIAYIKETIDNDALNGDVKEAFLSKIEALKADGHTVEEVSFPLMEYALPTYYILTTAEASSNLSRYDGVRFGHRSTEAKNLEEMYKKSRAEGFGEEVLKRILLGTAVLSASYHDAYYLKAQKVRRMIQSALNELLENYDFVAMPTAPTTAFELGAKTENSMEMYLADLFTVQASVAGVPAISVPVGRDQDGMSIGLQLITKAFDEAKLLAFSNYLLEN
ncbi:Asp-tRNA(Asn)/Glu-tRNA(Gln) amidotransferase subunit GatA [Marinoscillum furvescens]|uniref:Glutamyl-tRNA(Gln) amidotransferase subunit A n=1 Tax=Marinoscillum furvescens DSM 4134 TaxID=1122208 RepID=A0A3D9LJD4_MARFU|nr:Asp-tRNA(Asn)/Glu-tRNA(Gln) amidotransferase subunit GatA [Marinoscillum furvescens]REE05985.1 aspartyl/glutamyl-tRNA(Asn/Gln) amidotransferase subunit A [Marinoscillum furvescens DSM 4134]